MLSKAEYWIQHLGLKKHQEGGYYREMYRAEESIPQGALPERYEGHRNFYTSIYYLLTGEECSLFHRLKSDEIWHFYDGSPLTLYLLSKKSGLTTEILGNDPEQNQHFQFLVPMNTWFAAKHSDPKSFSLCGCSVSPGFDFSDFELAEKDVLLSLFPRHESIIRELC